MWALAGRRCGCRGGIAKADAVERGTPAPSFRQSISRTVHQHLSALPVRLRHPQQSTRCVTELVRIQMVLDEVQAAHTVRAARMDGDYTWALSQHHQVFGKPYKATPLHYLCNSSDVAVNQLSIVMDLVENKIVSAKYFSDLRDAKVVFFTSDMGFLPHL